MPTTTTPSDQTQTQTRTRTIFYSCLASAFRTALACTVVGCATLYTPTSIQNHLIPAFSYVTVILLVTDATLGDTFRGCWLALYATIQSAGPAVLSLWLIGTARLNSATTALAVALAAFVVALPEWTHLVSKRIALGQIVIIYVFAFIDGEKIEAVLHPLHIAASTAVGVFACVIALMVPFPRLASTEVREKWKLLGENAKVRLGLFVKAFCAEDNTTALSSVSQAKVLALPGTKLLQSIKGYQESMQWERPPFKIFRPYNIKGEEQLKEIDVSLRGMEMALTKNSSFPVKMLNGQLKNNLLKLEEQAISILKQIKISSIHHDSQTIPDQSTKFFQTLQTIPPTLKELPSFFFLFCFKNLINTKRLIQKGEESSSTHSHKPNKFSFKEFWNRKRLIPAFKCSISLGLAVFLGSLYSKENGHWAGLPVAISFATSREATFRVSNIKAQGTVIGTVYGVLGCFLFHKFLPLRFLSLLPWFVFTNFLRGSKMYSQAGGISAVIGAVLILGRKDFGPPKDFAIARIVETFIGLSCSIMVELIFQPTRASIMAKVQLSKTLATMHECICSLNLQSEKSSLMVNQNRLKIHVNELRKLIEEAEMEPNFWFLPFRSDCYCKILQSKSTMVNLFLFAAHAVRSLDWKEDAHQLDEDIEGFKNIIGSSIKCNEEITSIKSLIKLDKELEKKNVSCDIELGKLQNPNFSRVHDLDEGEIERMVNSYLQHSREIVEKKNEVDGDNKEFKSQMVLSLSTLGFCLNGLVRETMEIEKGIKELVQWENPSSSINLYEISCKIFALNK